MIQVSARDKAAVVVWKTGCTPVESPHTVCDPCGMHELLFEQHAIVIFASLISSAVRSSGAIQQPCCPEAPALTFNLYSKHHSL
jgi:hypothetical protein